MSSEDLTNKLIELVERSEERIGSTNEMVNKLAETCRKNAEMFDEHLLALVKSRDLAQKSASDAIALSKEMGELLADLREDFKAQVNSLKSELHLLRDEYRKDLDETRNDYRKLAESYRRMAESRSGQNVSEVNISGH